MIEMKVSGLNKVVEDMKKLSDTDKIVEKTMDEARVRCETYAIGYCPKDTGELAESIYAYSTGNGFVIGALAKHAVFNEFGSITTPIGSPHSPIAAKKVGVRPFIRPAIYKVKQEMPEIFGKKLHEVIGHG